MTPDFGAAILSPTYWLMVAGTLAVVSLVVGVHFEALTCLNGWLPRLRISGRLRVLALIFAVLAIHTLEIWAYGGAIWFAAGIPELGRVAGVDELRLLDAIYLSTVTFTTVGSSDLVAHGPLRFLLGVEALSGFVLIAWSASFTYLEMQRDWRTRP